MGRGRGTEKKNTGGIIGRGYTATLSSPLLSSPLLCSLAHATLRHAVPCHAMPRRGAPLTKETCSLPAAARALASRRRDALLTILGQDSLSLSLFLSHSFLLLFSFLSLSLSFSTTCFHERDARVACILRAGDFAVSRGKGQPPLNVPPCLMRPMPSSCWLTACSHVATLGQGELPGAKTRPAGNTSVAIILPAVQLISRFSCGFRSPSSGTLFHSFACLCSGALFQVLDPSATDSTTSLREVNEDSYVHRNSLKRHAKEMRNSKNSGDLVDGICFPRPSSSPRSRQF